MEYWKELGTAQGYVSFSFKRLEATKVMLEKFELEKNIKHWRLDWIKTDLDFCIEALKDAYKNLKEIE